MNIEELHAKSVEIRRSIISMVNRAKSGHVGGSLSATDILVALYYHLMNHDPKDPNWPKRDRFILSKGHCTPVIYAILADCGYFPKSDLDTFRRPGSHLQGHPYAPKTPGIEASTGTLGIGVSTGMGMALAAKLRGEQQTYYLFAGDGEIQEGQVWEASAFANKYQLDNVLLLVDRNGMQSDGISEEVMPMGSLCQKWEAFGWEAFEIDGHNFQEIIKTVNAAKTIKKPVVIICNTVKGKGVSFMENDNTWHGTPPDDEITKKALAELV